MQEFPLISVIITAYNRGDLVARAVASAREQTYPNIEIIAVDDASTDHTLDVLEQIKIPHFRIIKNSKNLGASGAKNIGVENAKGEYIAFLDSDDVWNINKLELQYAALKKAGDIPLSFSATRIHRNNGRKIIRIAKYKSSWYRSIIFAETFSLGSTLLARKECFQKVGKIDESLVRFEDRDWCLRYFDHYTDFIYIRKPLVDVYNSSTWVSVETVKDSARRILALNKERICSHNKTDYQIFSSSMQLEIATAFWRNNQKLLAVVIILSTCAKNPRFSGHLAYRITRKIIQSDFF